jgi:hypothetical protein
MLNKTRLFWKSLRIFLYVYRFRNNMTNLQMIFEVLFAMGSVQELEGNEHGPRSPLPNFCKFLSGHTWIQSMLSCSCERRGTWVTQVTPLIRVTWRQTVQHAMNIRLVCALILLRTFWRNLVTVPWKVLITQTLINLSCLTEFCLAEMNCYRLKPSRGYFLCWMI